MHPRLRHPYRSGITLLATAGVAISLAACGGGGGQANAQQTFQDAALKFAQCMRQHGVDVPDPQTGGGGIQIQAGQNGIDPQSQTFKDAQSACQHFMQDAVPADQRPNPAEMQDQLLKLAQCMREHGIDMADPKVNSDGSIEFGGPAGSGSGSNMPDRGDPAFKAAQEACQKETGIGGPDGGETPFLGGGPPGTSNGTGGATSGN
jgi:hypothetical protein